MKVVAGMGTIDDYEEYVNAGADELFAGYVPYRWQRQYEHGNPLNRREVSYSNVNIGSESELEILAEKISKRGVLVTLAFNSLGYMPEEYPVITDILEDCRKHGFNKIIIADFGLLIYMWKQGLSSDYEIHLSGELGEMNSFLINRVKKLGVDRIIYHRGIDISDLNSMTGKYPELEHEVFFMNEKCQFTGAYCNSLHCDEMVPMCRMPYIVKTSERKEVCEWGGIDGCGVCFLKKLQSAGATHLKIVGRGAISEDMINSISIARKAIDASSAIADEEEYIHIAKNQIVNEKCSGRCYY